MAQYLMVYDNVSERLKRTSTTIADLAGVGVNFYHFENSGGETVFSVGEDISASTTVCVYMNGILLREGASNDYQLDLANDEVELNFSASANSLLTVQVYETPLGETFDDFDVTNPAGQTQFVCSTGTVNAVNKIEVWQNGIYLREGASYDWERNESQNAIDFNYTVPQNAWVRVKIQELG